MLTDRTQRWAQSGRIEEIGGRRLFVREQPGAGPPMLFLHGFPTSSYDWRHVFSADGGGHRVAFDLPGFGLSEKPSDGRYSLLTAADLVARIAERFGDEPVLLVAHDMGDSLACELLARDLEGNLGFTLGGLLMLNGTIVTELGTLTVSQKLLRSRFGPIAAMLASEGSFRLQMGHAFSRSHPLDAEEAADAWALLCHEGGNRVLDRLTLYLRERVRYAARWRGALGRWPGRLVFAWGLADPYSGANMLHGVRNLRPRAQFVEFPELGHYPHLEDPAAVLEVIGAFAAGASVVA